jgi:hypothetical protein
MTPRRGSKPIAYARVGFFLIVPLLPAWSWAQPPSRVAPLYSLPAAGTWVEYAWRASGPNGRDRTGTLRISFIGEKEVQGVTCCWIELERRSQVGGKTRSWVRKVLVDRAAVQAGDPLGGHIREGYERRGEAGAPVTRLSSRQLDDFFGLGFEGLDAGLKLVGDEEVVQTGLGRLAARQVTATGHVQGRLLEYRAWLTDRIPFGWAQFAVRATRSERPAHALFTIRAERSGTNARSALAELSQGSSCGRNVK